MKILFVTAHPFLPDMIGGAQRSAHALMKRLQERGHEPALLCHMGQSFAGLKYRMRRKLTRSSFSLDHDFGYPIYRSWTPWAHVKEVKEDFQPSLAIILARQPVRMGLAVQAENIPMIMMLQDAEMEELGGDFKELHKETRFVANSQFTAQAYEKAFGIDASVIHPIIEPELYQTDVKPSYVTFINPHAVKGLDIALSVAGKCPDIPFLFAGGWPMSAQEKRDFNVALKDRPNIKFVPVQKDVCKIYAQTKILLVPSRWQEAFGRVVAEAQINAIPVIASTQGGLPESVGAGGITLPIDAPVSDWAKQVRLLWSDQDAYTRYSQAAKTHSQRQALDPAYQTNLWEEVIL